MREKNCSGMYGGSAEHDVGVQCLCGGDGN